ncbi:hypothetical protein ZWY2020_015641 [Hordeum vulgare]|nr:hypothetical protein ZWY2020_015641 [Hordeum vulgare]
MDSLPIPGELVVDILLRVPDAADLVRASAACVSFRRIVADRSFLRRYRRLHAPPLLGFLSNGAFRPAEPPHSSASAANAVSLAGDFSFSFLPAPARDWIVRDIRDGRVLLDRPRSHDHTDWTRRNPTIWETAVCDPLHRRYLVLPPFPQHLAATAVGKSEAFLIPSDRDDDDDEEEASFRVMLMVQGEAKLFGFVFSSSTGQWRAGPSQPWGDLFSDLLTSTDIILLYFRRYAHGYFYWVTIPTFFGGDEMKLLVFDTSRMEFSIAEPPPEAKSCRSLDTHIAMVETGEGRPGMFVLESRPPYISLHYTMMMQNSAGSSIQWQKVKTITLSPGFSYALAGSVGRYLLLLRREVSPLSPNCFTLDIKTFQLERICGRKYGHAYSNFPPSLLSSPTVSSGKRSCLS